MTEIKLDKIIEEYEHKARISAKSIDRMEHLYAKDYQQIADLVKELKLFRQYADNDLVSKVTSELKESKLPKQDYYEER